MQGKLDIKFCPQYRSSWRVDVDHGRVIEHQLNAHKLHIFLAEIGKGTIDNGQENQRVRVGHLKEDQRQGS